MENLLALLLGGLLGIVVGRLFKAAYVYLNEVVNPKLVACIMSRLNR